MQRHEGTEAWRLKRRDRRRAQRARRRRLAAVGGLVSAVGVAVAIGLVSSGGTRHRALPVTHVARRVPVVVSSPRPPVRHVRDTAAVPILMYHVIASAPAHAPFPGLYVRPAEFAAQVDALARAGYRGVTLDQVNGAWRGRNTLPKHPIVLTFDNGYRTQYSRALPVLSAHGWVADENLQLSGLPPKQGGLNRAQVIALVRAGWELDTQGFVHADLPILDAKRLRYEVQTARRTIRRLYGVRSDWFCYPSGRYDTTVIAAVKAAGYVGATTVAPGWAKPTEDPYRLPRIRVVAGTSPATLLQLLTVARNAGPPPPSY